MSSAPGQGGPDAPVAVTVPSWLATDWGTATAIAIRTILVFVVLGLAFLLSTLVIVMIRFGSAGMDLGTVIATALSLPLAYLGAFENSPILLTGILVLVWSLRLAHRSVSLPALSGERSRAFALAGKVAVISVLVLLVIAILLDTLDLFSAGGLGAGLGLIQTPFVDYVRVVFLTGPLIACFAFVQIAKKADVGLLTLDGAVRMPAIVITSWTGAKRVLRIALIGLLALFALGSVLEMLSSDFGDFGMLADAILSVILLVVVFVAVDVAVLFFVSAMSFLQFQALGTGSAWEWAGVALVAVAFFLGGRAAAKRASPNTVAEAVAAASLVGVLLSALGVLVAINYQGLADFQGFAAPAILLPLLWTIPALVGAWWYANEQRLPSGVAVAVQTTPAAPVASSVSDSTPNAGSSESIPTPTPPPPVKAVPVPLITDEAQAVMESQAEAEIADPNVSDSVGDDESPGPTPTPPPLPEQDVPDSPLRAVEPQAATAEEAAPTDLKCASCGASNPPGNTFCTSCGRRVSSAI